MGGRRVCVCVVFSQTTHDDRVSVCVCTLYIYARSNHDLRAYPYYACTRDTPLSMYIYTSLSTSIYISLYTCFFFTLSLSVFPYPLRYLYLILNLTLLQRLDLFHY